MSEYGALKPLQRAALKSKDPKRFESIKAEHDRQEQVLLKAMASAKTHEDYKATRAEYQLFQAGGDPWSKSGSAA